MVSMPKYSPNSVCRRVAACRNACCWSMDRSRYMGGKGDGAVGHVVRARRQAGS